MNILKRINYLIIYFVLFLVVVGVTRFGVISMQPEQVDPGLIYKAAWQDGFINAQADLYNKEWRNKLTLDSIKFFNYIK